MTHIPEPVLDGLKTMLADAAQKGGQLVSDRLTPQLQEADALLDRVLLLRMYGEGAPGCSDTWRQLDTDIEAHLRAQQ